MHSKPKNSFTNSYSFLLQICVAASLKSFNANLSLASILHFLFCLVMTLRCVTALMQISMWALILLKNRIYCQMNQLGSSTRTALRSQNENNRIRHFLTVCVQTRVSCTLFPRCSLEMEKNITISLPNKLYPMRNSNGSFRIFSTLQN